MTEKEKADYARGGEYIDYGAENAKRSQAMYEQTDQYKRDKEKLSALDKQEGGNHYKDYAIQPVTFIHGNKLGFLEGCVIKRLCRWQRKDGIKDLRKAIHEIELLIELTEMAEKREHAKRQDRERLAVKLGHPMTGDQLTTSAEQAVRDFVKAHPQMPTGATGPAPNERPQPDPLSAVNRAPAADSNIPGYCVPEGAEWPPTLLNGTRILVWRPRGKGDIGSQLYGWVEIGFMWDGELVRHEAQG